MPVTRATDSQRESVPHTPPRATPMLPRHLKTKDARSALLRAPRLEDAPMLHACNRAVVIAGVGSTRSVDELDKTAEQILEETRIWVDGPRTGASGCMVVAEIDSNIVGGGVIHRMPQARLNHSAHIGIGIRPEGQGVGIGRAIMEELIWWATDGDGKGITRIDLAVFADNTRAIRLYESLGFEHEGRRRNMIRYEDGRHVDDLIMARLLG